MAKTKQQKNDDGINYKKLFFELMTVLTVLFIAMIGALYPVLKERGVFDAEDEFAVYDELLETVDYYDGSKGRDKELEERLNTGYYDDQTTNAMRTFYYGIASATYYCEIGYYNTADQIFNALYQNVPSGKRPRMDLEVRDVICKRKMAKNDV